LRRIVEAPRLQPEHIGQSLQPGGDLAPAVRAEAALDRFSGVTDDPVITQLAAKIDRGFRHDQYRRVVTPARLLAIAAMTIHHQDRIGFGLVPHRAASTPAGDFLRHRMLPLFRRSGRV
jgi:hypothetical protein